MKKQRMVRAILIILWMCTLGLKSLRADGLEPLSYHHPGLVVDLGVGLWAWPIPCDADGDGDFDLIVSCPDKPSNGVWLFENSGVEDASIKMPVFSPGRQLSKTVHYVMPSYVDGRLRVLSPGVEYLDFAKSGIEQKKILPIDPHSINHRGLKPRGRDSAQPMALCRFRW